MTDYTKLNSNVETLAAKVDDLLLKVNTPPPAPIDEQPAVDAVDAKVEAILAKIAPLLVAG